MSEPAHLPPGLYKILSVAAEPGNRLTGIGDQESSTLPVHVDARIHIWELIPEGEPGHYHLSLRGAPRFTGVDGILEKKVIVTDKEERNVKWHIRYWKDLDVFTIGERPIWPHPAWTLASEDPYAEIRIKLFEISPWREQRFKIVPLLEE